MEKTSIQRLARMVCDLPVNGNIYVQQYANSELFGITCLNLFESDLIIISHFGGGLASTFDTSTNNEENEVCSWLQYALGADNSEKIVYLLTENEVYGIQSPHNELWGVTFCVNQPGTPSYRTLAISECPIFSTQEAAETWINDHRGMRYDTAFYAEDCSDPKPVLIDRWRNDNNDAVTTNNPSVSTFKTRIKNLRDDMITNIASILKENNLSEIELDGMVRKPTFVLWCDEDGNWYDSPVKTVSLDSTGISIDVEDEDENVSTTLYSKDADVAFKNPDWLKSLLDNIPEAIEAKKRIKNDIQLSLFKDWNYYLNVYKDEKPRYVNVSIRFKDDNCESKQIISLTDYSENTADRVFHYVRSLQELIQLADTDKDATVENFIIIGLDEYTDHIKENR